MRTRASRERLDELPLAPEVTQGTKETARNRGDVPGDERMLDWSDKEKSVKLRAHFVRIINKRIVELRDASGLLHQVPLNSLSAECLYQAVELELAK